MLIGVVGKPSTGKSTFFKALTLAEVEIANYPFTTIKPNRGFGFVKVDCVDKDFDTQCNPRTGYCLEHKRFVPVEVLDVAGLVPGAHKGEGLGNQFLEDLRPADALLHIIDISGSTNAKGEDVELGSYDPVNDVEFLEDELDMWYFQILEKGWKRFARQVSQEKQEIAKALAKQLSALKVSEEMVEIAIKNLKLDSNPETWTDEDLKKLSTELRFMSKPILIVANKIDVKGAKENYERLKEKFSKYIFIPCSAESELALKEAAKKELIDYIPGDKSFEIKKELNEKQKQALKFIQKNVLDVFGFTGVQEAIDKSVFELLKYIAIFPGGVNKLADSEGNVLPDVFLLPEKSTALDFAYKLHTDFGDKFIRAIDVKTKMTIGKDHILKNRDVIEIISGK